MAPNDSGALTNPVVILAYLRNKYLEKRNAIPMQNNNFNQIKNT